MFVIFMLVTYLCFAIAMASNKPTLDMANGATELDGTTLGDELNVAISGRVHRTNTVVLVNLICSLQGLERGLNGRQIRVSWQFPSSFQETVSSYQVSNFLETGQQNLIALESKT